MAIVILFAPTLATGALFLLLLLYPPRPTRTRKRELLAQTTSGSLAFFTIISQCVLLARTLFVHMCDAQMDLHEWTAVLPVVGVGSTDAILIYMTALTFPYLVSVCFLALAGGVGVVEWAIRGGVTVSRGSHLLVAVQQTFDILAICSLYHTTMRKQLVGTNQRHHSVVHTVDPLSKKGGVQMGGHGCDREPSTSEAEWRTHMPGRCPYLP